MRKLVLDRRNLDLEYEQGCIIIRSKDDPSRSIPIKHLDQVVCMHGVTITSSLIGQLVVNGIDLIVLNQRYADNSFALYANQQKQVEKRCLQYSWQQQANARLKLAKVLCAHKFKVTSQYAEKYGFLKLVDQANNAIHASNSAHSEGSIRGIEGALQRHAFEMWRQLLPSNLEFCERRRRPPPDPVNSILSLTYMVVLSEAIRQCKIYGLDSQLGFYHRVQAGRHSLACDLIETLRPHIECWVVQMFVHETLVKKHFTTSKGVCILTKDHRPNYYQQLDKQTTIWRRRLQSNARWLCHKITKAL